MNADDGPLFEDLAEAFVRAGRLAVAGGGEREAVVILGLSQVADLGDGAGRIRGRFRLLLGGR